MVSITRDISDHAKGRKNAGSITQPLTRQEWQDSLTT